MQGNPKPVIVGVFAAGLGNGNGVTCIAQSIFKDIGESNDPQFQVKLFLTGWKIVASQRRGWQPSVSRPGELRLVHRSATLIAI